MRSRTEDLLNTAQVPRVSYCTFPSGAVGAIHLECDKNKARGQGDFTHTLGIYKHTHTHTDCKQNLNCSTFLTLKPSVKDPVSQRSPGGGLVYCSNRQAADTQLVNRNDKHAEYVNCAGVSVSNLSACFPETLGARELVIMVSRQVKRRLDRIIAGQICAALHGLAEV